jgi:hypothetical protein
MNVKREIENGSPLWRFGDQLPCRTKQMQGSFQPPFAEGAFKWKMGTIEVIFLINCVFAK